jgi:hypothetical protein
MRKMIAIGVAGALATASIGATTQSANASGGAIIGGVAIGLGLAALFHHGWYGSYAYAYPYYPYATYSYAYPYGYPYATYSYAPAYANNHVAWCSTAYISYNAATDTYVGYDGYYHRCISPVY